MVKKSSKFFSKRQLNKTKSKQEKFFAEHGIKFTMINPLSRGVKTNHIKRRDNIFSIRNAMKEHEKNRKNKRRKIKMYSGRYWSKKLCAITDKLDCLEEANNDKLEEYKDLRYEIK